MTTNARPPALAALAAAALLALPAAAQPDPSANPEKAAKKYAKLVEKAPDNPDNWYNLGLAHCLLENWTDAVPAAERAAELAPESARFRYVLGKALKGAGRADEAVAAYEKAVELDPGMLEAQAELGDAYLDAGRHDDAVSAYKGALKTKPENPGGLYVGLGNAYLGKGEVDSAIKWFKRSTEGNPNDPVAWFNLGVVLNRLARSEAALRPEAADAFARAADLAPRDADSLFMAGLTAFMADRNDVAEGYLRSFLKVEPSGKRAADAQVYLDELSK